MSKNMTRRATAFAGSAVLAIAGLTAAPAANAAETLALAPSAGAEYAALTTSSFQLDAGFGGTESTAAQGTLKFRVVNDGDAALSIGIAEGADATVTGFQTGTTTQELDVDPTEPTTDDDTSDDDFVAFSQNGTPVIGAAQSITIEPTAGFTSNIVVSVQAFLDLDGDNAIDSNEPTSPAREVTFYAAKNVTGTATLEAPVLGATALTANASFSPALNVQQLDSTDVRVRFLVNNSTAALSDTGGAATDDTDAGYFAATYDSVEKVVDADLTALTPAITAASVYGAQVYFFDGAGTDEADYAKSGTANYENVAKGTVNTLDAVAVRPGNSVTNAGAASLLREGSGTFTVEADVSAVDTGASVAGQTVTFIITDTALSSGATITAGGQTLTSAGTSIRVDAVSAANGEAELVISYSGFEADDSDAFTIGATALGASAVVQAGGAATNLTITAHASTGDTLVDGFAGAKQIESVIAASTTITYTVVDEFGQTPDGEFQLVVTEDGTGSFSGTAPVSTSGTASYTFVENSPSANDYTVTAQLQKKDTSGVFQDVGGTTEATLISAVTAAQVPAAVTNTADDDGSGTKVALTLADQATSNEEIAAITATAPTTDTNFVSGTVTSANGTPLKGVVVNLSAPTGIMFTSEDGFSNGVGSLAVRTNTSGVYKAFVTSNIAGKQTITATSGSASAAEVIEFAAAKDDTATSVAVSAPANAQPGTTFKVTVTVTDKYGNPVTTDTAATNYNDGSTDPTFVISYTGPGLIVGTLPTKTDNNGQASFSVLLGSNDSGSSVTTASYDADGTSTAFAAVATSATTSLGVATPDYGTMSAWTVDQGDGTAKVYVKFPTIGEKVRIGHQTGGSGSYETIYVKTLDSESHPDLTVNAEGSYIVRTIDLVDGTNRIRVTVGDDREVQVRYNE